jgi:opacity protein-like surface antigen
VHGFECAGTDTPGRWYLGLDAGLALQQDTTLRYAGGDNRLSFDPGFRLDLSGGVHLSQSWRAEVEMGLIFNSSEGRSKEYCQVPVLVNGIYSLPLHGRMSAYVGAGLGGVYSALWDVWDADGSLTLGFQGIVGARYAISDTFDLGLSYKLLGTLEHDLGPYTLDGTFSPSFLAPSPLTTSRTAAHFFFS